MSLILDALKKLERDKQAPEPGVLVVGSVPWQGLRRAAVRPALLWGALAGLAALAALYLVWPEHPRPTPTPPRMATAAGVAAVRSTPASGTPTGAPSRASTDTAAQERSRRATPAEAVPRRQQKEGATAPTATHSQTSTAATTRPALVLDAIGEREGRRAALVNGRLVYEGDMFDGVRILRIGETEVEVEVDGHRRVLGF